MVERWRAHAQNGVERCPLVRPAIRAGKAKGGSAGPSVGQTASETFVKVHQHALAFVVAFFMFGTPGAPGLTAVEEVADVSAGIGGCAYALVPAGTSGTCRTPTTSTTSCALHPQWPVCGRSDRHGSGGYGRLGRSAKRRGFPSLAIARLVPA